MLPVDVSPNLSRSMVELAWAKPVSNGNPRRESVLVTKEIFVDFERLADHLAGLSSTGDNLPIEFDRHEFRMWKPDWKEFCLQERKFLEIDRPCVEWLYEFSRNN